MNKTLSRIRDVFKASGKSQTEIGKLLNKTPQYVWKLLNDDETNPSRSAIGDICRVFHVSETWIYTGEGEMEAPQTKENMIAELTTKYAKMDVNSAKYKLCMTLSRLLVDMDDSMVDELMDVARQLADNSSSEE